MTKATKRRFKGIREKWMVQLFFLPFLLIGLALLGLAAMDVARHLASQSWQPVSATLLARGVDVQQNTYGGDKINGATRTSGKYAYRWQGRRYESTRLSFSSAMTKSWGMTPDDWDDRIDDALGSGDTFTAWVDPDNPQHAVVLRDIRWLETGIEIIFGLLLVWASALFLFGYDPNAAAAGFSWRTVGMTWLIGIPLGVLVPLLWRDHHQIWAVIAAFPLLLAAYGTVYGLRH